MSWVTCHPLHPMRSMAKESHPLQTLREHQKFTPDLRRIHHTAGPGSAAKRKSLAVIPGICVQQKGSHSRPGKQRQPPQHCGGSLYRDAR